MPRDLNPLMPKSDISSSRKSVIEALDAQARETASKGSGSSSGSALSAQNSKSPAPEPVASTDPIDLALNGDLADAAGYAGSAPDPHDSTCLPDLAEPGETMRDKLVFDFLGDWDTTRAGNNNVVTQLDSGLQHDVSDGVITYAFFTHQHALGLNNNPSFGEGRGYTPFTPEQMAAGRLAIQNWDDLLAVEFREVTPERGAKTWAQNSVDIWMANTYTGPAQAWAYYPGYGQPYKKVAGDVWIADPRYNSSNAQLDAGFYGLQTLNHELGHAIGLSHPGNYNFGDDSDGDGEPDPITYEGDAFYYQDNHQYTIMSYFDMYEAGNNQVDWNFMRLMYPSTPMVHDVWVAQYKYGADMTTRSGDTTYGFNATDDVTNDAMRFETGEIATIFTIWDGGGNDTLDLSGYHTSSVIDLREGGYSSAGGFNAYGDAPAYDPTLLSMEEYLAYVNAYNQSEGLPNRSEYLYQLYFEGVDGVNEGVAWADIMGRDWLMENNIGIAYGAVIENAIGGEGDDRINGNQANNQFTGGGGADTFIIADYSGTISRPTGDVVIVDTSVDTIMDFEAGTDTISLCDLGVSWSDLSSQAVTGGALWTVERGDNDLQFYVMGDQATESDFFFG